MTSPQATGVRFVHSADWQLGMTRHFLSAEAQARYSEARLEAIREIAKLAEGEGCAFVVVSGDVFDSNHLDRQVVVRALDAMSTFTVPLFLLPANHDSANAASVYRSTTFLDHRPENLVVLDTFEPVAVPGTDVEVIGAPWDSKQPLEDLVAKACAELTAGQQLRVLVAHGAIDAASPDSQNPALIHLATAQEAIASRRVDYIALGDRHSMTRIGDTDRIWYSGTPLVTDFDEAEPNHVLIVDLDQKSVSVEAHEVGKWCFLRQTFAVNNRDEVDGVSDWLERIDDKRNAVVKLAFVGTLNLTEKAHLDEVVEHFSDLFASLEAWELQTDLAVLPDEQDLRDLGLTGFAAATLEELRADAVSGGEAGQVAQEALGLLYRLTVGRR